MAPQDNSPQYFLSKNQVRMHDTDMAGILYFARQFRFAHDALEDFFKSVGYTFHNIFHDQNFVFVIVHAEADYLKALKVGDELQVHLTVEKIGTSSISFLYHIFREKELVGTVKTVHVTLDSKTRVKLDVPDIIREKLSKYLVNQ
jgi:1,4-dihydroxy-2-naphthoyl-CoA hydrolase